MMVMIERMRNESAAPSIYKGIRTIANATLCKVKGYYFNYPIFNVSKLNLSRERWRLFYFKNQSSHRMTAT